jgi:cytidine deaminase
MKFEDMQALIDTAKRLIDACYSPRHQVGAVLRAKDGRLFESVSVQGQKLNLCSEWSALTQALMAGADAEMIVAVYKNKEGEHEIFSPCGICRELFATYFPQMKVIVSETEVVDAADLLPYMWKKRK